MRWSLQKPSQTWMTWCQNTSNIRYEVTLSTNTLQEFLLSVFWSKLHIQSITTASTWLPKCTIF
jgi:hypothetical protein